MMEPEQPDGASAPWTAGTISVLRSEAERVRALSRSLEDFAVDLRQIDPGAWSGRAHDAFAERRTGLAGRCRQVAETHASAARALDDYVAVLEQLTRSAQYSTDSLLLRRLAGQRAEAAARAAAALTGASGELTTLRVLLGDLDQPRARQLVPRQPSKLPQPVDAPAEPGLAPSLLLTNRVEFDKGLQHLSDAMWLFWSRN
ncbi:putative T7SS-secreted protein [Amycolatopsis sp. NPDC051071]|uniref:putative T7SS-secreted protein n=1 Tax=Amycolatopsis sp. NPDC051071 TaxID=3154637 RepID=UPI00341AF4AF